MKQYTVRDTDNIDFNKRKIHEIHFNNQAPLHRCLKGF